MTGNVAHTLVTFLLASGLGGDPDPCATRDFAVLGRNPTAVELRCRFDIVGPGRFGLLSYLDVPVYQPATPMPGTHVIGVPGHARPHLFESYEAWEWRVLRTEYGPEVREIHRELETLDPRLAARILELERRLKEEGVRAVRRETWRSPQRQAYLFQQGRSRPGPLATATLTSWHSHVDPRGNPAGRAVDYDMPASQLPGFHEIVAEVGLQSFGADSHDPWHVFLPGEEIPHEDVALLRTLPRVPEVTLATGLPVDRPLPAGGIAAIRRAAGQFAGGPFIPFPVARLVSTARGPILAPVQPSFSATLAASPKVSRGAEWTPPVVDGGPGERWRGAGTAAAKSYRSRDD